MSLSCEEDSHFAKTYYYSTGELLSETSYRVEDSLKDGTYKEYYKNGNLKKTILLKAGKPIDSAMAFFESGELSFKEIRTKDTLYTYYFNKQGNNILRSKFLNTNPPIQIGWTLGFNNEGEKTDSIQHVNVGGKGFLNQRYHFNNKKRVILDSSYFYNFKVSKINGSDSYQFKVEYEPSISEAQVFLILSDSINSDFSNLNSVKSDTLFMKNNSLFTNTLNKSYRKLRGYFYEYYTSIIDTVHKDSIRMRIREKKTFFDEYVKVSDTIDIN